MGTKIVDNEFKTVAYNAAILAIRERFSLQLTKDQVKDRFKSWKREYFVLRNLLDQGDFEWDDQRKMLVAKDSVWDVSVEVYNISVGFSLVHRMMYMIFLFFFFSPRTVFKWYYVQLKQRNPDARLLRGTVIENYDELCIIIGYDNPSESSLNPANVNLDLTANNEAINAGVVCYNQSNNAAEKENFITWTEEMDTCLSKLLVEQVVLGNRIEETFKTAAYTAALTVLNERFALDLTKENIRSRLNTWEKQYGRVKLLLSHDGFEWDERHKMVVANDFDWTAYIKVCIYRFIFQYGLILFFG